MGQDKAAEDGGHERVRAFSEKLINPELESSCESEVGPEDLIFTEYEKEDTDRHAEKSHGAVVESVNAKHARSISFGQIESPQT